ncbi:MAG: replication initiator protein A [Hyphomicrobiaceae bacterium]
MRGFFEGDGDRRTATARSARSARRAPPADGLGEVHQLLVAEPEVQPPGAVRTGVVTAYDYDIFIHMVTHLAVAMRDYKQAEAKGLRPPLPPRTYRPSAAELLKFCRRDRGGKQYDQLEPSLNRLQATRYKITNLAAGSSRRAAESFSLIGRYKVVSRTIGDKIDQVEIDIPEWVYSGVVSPGEAPSILTLNPDYFLISRPLGKYIYRLARKATEARGIADYGLDTLYHRSESTCGRQRHQ